MISIITPVYNKEKHLKKTIESILNQTEKDFELILINDGSTDNSLNIIKEYKEKDPRIKLFDQTNKGVSTARNVGINHAKGEYITFFDADDSMYEEALKIMKEKIGSNDILMFKTRVIEKGKNYIRPKHRAFKKDFLIHYIDNKFQPTMNGYLIRREFLIREGIYFNENIDYGEDMEFVIRLLSKTQKIKQIDDILNAYNKENQSLSKESLKLIDKDKAWVKLAVNELTKTKHERAVKLLREYRLSGNILNHLKQNRKEKNFKHYYDENIAFLQEISLVNGLRSLKLKYKIRKLKKDVDKSKSW